MTFGPTPKRTPQTLFWGFSQKIIASSSPMVLTSTRVHLRDIPEASSTQHQRVVECLFFCYITPHHIQKMTTILGETLTADDLDMAVTIANTDIREKIDWCPLPSEHDTVNFRNRLDKLEMPTKRYEVCWIDPGVVNFMTIMDEDGVEVYGDEIVAGAAAMAHHGEDYDPREHHLVLARHLSQAYAIIIIPELDPTQEKRLSPIGLERRTYLGHRMFYRRLRRECRKTGTKYIVTAEHETSMKCCVCGIINPFQSKGRVVSCSTCGSEMDRDVNGVRNIGSRFVAVARHRPSPEEYLRVLFDERAILVEPSE